MKKRFRWPMLIALVILFITVFFLLACQGIRRIPSMDEQLPPGSDAIQIQVTHPQNKSSWPMNYLIPIQITVWGAEPVTSLELYVNGFLYDTKTVSENTPYDVINTQWNWQPGDIGIYLLTARAVGASGSYGISDPVMIESTPDFSTGAPIEIKESTTLEQIAKDVDVSLIDLQNANPHLPADQPVQVGEKILIPNLPKPVVNSIIPAFDPQGQSVSYPDPNYPEEEQFINPPKWNKINDLLFLVKRISIPGVQSNEEQQPENQPSAANNNPNDISDPSKLPEAADIYGNSDGCNVNLYVEPMGYNANDGYFIYRSRDGDPFERIATLPKFTYSDWGLQYTDENQYGLVSYYAAAFNDYGENPGPAKPFPLDPMNCNNGNGFIMPKMNTIWLEDNGDLSLKANLDTAYLYIQIDNNQAERAPKGNRMFLANSGVKFNLYTYLESRSDLKTMTDFIVQMEIWGWQSGELRFVGNLEHAVHRSVLLVCDTEGEGKCSAGSLGNWDTEMTILPHIYKSLNEQKYELRWLTSIYSYPEEICLRIGEEFNGPELSDLNSTLLNACFKPSASDTFTKNEGTYLLDFGEFLYPDGTPYFPDFAYKHPLGDPFDLAIRVKPQMKDTGFTDVSNTVFMHHLSPFEQDTLPPLASDIPSLYDIEIIENTYVPPTYEVWNKWACVQVDSDPSGKYDSGQIVCPVSYAKCGENVVCEDPGFWGMLGIAWDMIANSFSEIKNAIAGEIANIIPYCSDEQICKKAIGAGVDYAVTAITGLPPNLPNSDELMARGATEIIVAGLGDIADPETLGYICGEDCKDEIEAQLKPYMIELKSFYSQPGCFSPGDHYNMFPPCIPPPAVVHPIDGAYDFPGFVMVRVTRKSTPESLAATTAIKDKTKLYLVVDGENSSRIGEYANYCKYEDNITVDPDAWGYGPFGDTALQGQLYETVMVDIPWLEPGESFEIPVSLKQFHNQSEIDCITTTKSQYLFFQGISRMRAVEYCFSDNSSALWVPCTDGGSDTWDFYNPQGP